MQAPVLGEVHAPAGDFEAECRGSLEHARGTAGVAATAALSKVGFLIQNSLSYYFIFMYSQIDMGDAAAAHVLEAEEEEEAEQGNRALAQAVVDAAKEAAAAAKVSLLSFSLI